MNTNKSRIIFRWHLRRVVYQQTKFEIVQTRRARVARYTAALEGKLSIASKRKWGATGHQHGPGTSQDNNPREDTRFWGAETIEDMEQIRIKSATRSLEVGFLRAIQKMKLEDPEPPVKDNDCQKEKAFRDATPSELTKLANATDRYFYDHGYIEHTAEEEARWPPINVVPQLPGDAYFAEGRRVLQLRWRKMFIHEHEGRAGQSFGKGLACRTRWSSKLDRDYAKSIGAYLLIVRTLTPSNRYVSRCCGLSNRPRGLFRQK